MAYTPVSYDEYGNPTAYVDDNGNQISAWDLKTQEYNAALNSSDPWTRLAAQQMGHAGGGNVQDILAAFKPAQDFASMIGVDPNQAAASYGQGVTGNIGSPLYAGARDTLNQNLQPGWGMQQIAQDQGLLNPWVTNWLQQYVDQGDQVKEQYNARDSADSKAAMMKFGAGLAGLFGGGALGAFDGLSYGVAPEAGWTSGFDLPMGGVEYFGNVADAAGAGVSGGGTPGGTVADWTSGFDLIDPLTSAPSSNAGVSFQRALMEQLGVNPLGYNTGATAAAQTALDGMGSALPGMSLWDNILKGSKTLSSLFGNGGGLVDSSIFGGGGFNLGNVLGKGVDLTAAIGPSLAAINYAKNQDPFDTSQLQNAYNNIGAQTYNYDLNTNAGLNQLTSGLQRRGVMGSSFGNMDITNYNTSRELGRNDLLSQGARAQAGIANDILNAQVKDRLLKNDLYGRALSSIGTAVGGLR